MHLCITYFILLRIRREQSERDRENASKYCKMFTYFHAKYDKL